MVLEENGNVVSKRVCVIGAGPSGLVAARELRKEGHDVVVLEQKHDVGGQWLYDPNVEDEDPLGNPTRAQKVHSSIYANLRVFSPREIMGFTDFPFIPTKDGGGDSRRYPGHGEVLRYLRDFCERFGIRDMIRFNSKVEYVGMVNYTESGDVVVHEDLKWIVRSAIEEKQGVHNKVDQKAAAPVVAEEVFDAVVVASGHYSQPWLPTIKGMDVWKRKQMHSHVYRVPHPFKNEVVVIVGNSLSGQDISMALTSVAKEIHLSVKDLNVTEGLSKLISKHENLYLHPVVESMHEDGRVSFIDGGSIIADTIIYATGYSYSFPFLDTKGIVSIDKDTVGPLYHHTFPPLLAPSLSFVGIPTMVLGFPFFESQAKWIAQLLSGKKKLPSIEQMIANVQEFDRSRDSAGFPKRYTHSVLPYGGLEYCDQYADFSDSPHTEDWMKKLCKSSVERYFSDLENYRDSDDHDREMLQLAYQSSYFTNYANT